MQKKSDLLLLILFACCLAGGRGLEPPVVTGSLIKTGDSFRGVQETLGKNGVLFVRSQARWDQLMKAVPDLSTDTPLPKLDFSRESVVFVYSSPRRPADSFTLEQSDLAARPPQLNFLLHWDNSPMEQDDRSSTRFILAVIPAAQSVQVSLASKGIHPNGAQSDAEFTAALGDQNGGDIVDGLQANISTPAATIKPGDDILIDFMLHAPKLQNAHQGQFDFARPTVYVWDGKYSNGYRNHAFLVTTPDGKTVFLQPKEILQWDKNAPHPEEISLNKPYHLPNWSDDSDLKSLKQLGLNTAVPGVYVITGIYQEGSVDASATQPGKIFWAGSIASNSIAVRVVK